jgi:hypothetical protein
VNYATDARLEDRLDPLEPPYKSRGEAQIGRLLDRYGVPFFYEQPTLIYDRGQHRRWHPDFTLPTYASLVVEYAGMPELPDYAAGIRHKQHVYAANQIPAVFVYPQDLREREWPDLLLKSIYEAAGRAPYLAPHQGGHSGGYGSEGRRVPTG